MKVITKKSVAFAVAERWRRQYQNADGSWKYGDDKRMIFERISALEEPTCEKIDAIIGNNSWTECRCNECDRSVDAVVRIGEPPDYDSSTARICRECLSEALAAIEDAH